jgi:hypothetical protein
MTNLWRVLALAWLGGSASPVLAEDALDIDVAIYDRAEPATGDEMAVDTESTDPVLRPPEQSR